MEKRNEGKADGADVSTDTLTKELDMHPDSTPETPPLVLYHDSCNDGFCAAWLFWRHVNPKAEFVAVQYGDDPPDVTGRSVYMLDFSFKRPAMEDMLSLARGVTVLDHHQTAEKELEGLNSWARQYGFYCVCCFDMEKSGARLTWEILCLPGLEGAEAAKSPWLVDYTEDRDLWRWKLPYSREISAALNSYPRTIEQWNRLSGSNPQNLYPEGRAILRYQETVIQSAVKGAYEIEVAGYKVMVVNATSLVSEIGQELAKGRPFSVVTFFTKDKTVYSLRSAPDGVDVSEIAKRYGGGGHKHAAGFSTLKPELTW